MSIPSYHGNTFVAFLDICGFKEMILSSHDEARHALDIFYRTVNEETTTRERISCIAISDSAIIFGAGKYEDELGNGSQDLTDVRNLVAILSFIKNVARKMIDQRIAIKGSVNYGRFDYEKRFEGTRVVKAMLSGSAYISAYSDQEEGKPKLRLGQIRLTPKEKIDTLLKLQTDTVYNELSLLHSNDNAYYFYWMLDSPVQTNRFVERFNEAYERLYDPVKSLLKDYAEGLREPKEPSL